MNRTGLAFSTNDDLLDDVPNNCHFGRFGIGFPLVKNLEKALKNQTLNQAFHCIFD